MISQPQPQPSTTIHNQHIRRITMTHPTLSTYVSPFPKNPTVAHIDSDYLRMTSLDIAKLTHKRHDNVIRDIKQILSELQLEAAKYEDTYKDKQGKSRFMFSLPKFETDVVVSGYSTQYRAAIIKRWHELELDAPRISRADYFMHLADLERERMKVEEELKEVIRTKAWIGSKREATSMATASREKRRATKLEEELDQSKMYCSIKRMTLQCHGQEFKWRDLKSTSIEMGLPSVDVFDANYGTVKAYHTDVWHETYALRPDGSDEH